MFTPDELRKIAAWGPIAPDFERIDPIRDCVQPAIAQLAKSGRWECRIIDDGGLSNYYSILVHQSLTKQELGRSRHHEPHNGVGMIVYASLMTPIATMGLSRFAAASNSFSAQPLELEAIVDPIRGKHEVVDAILKAFDATIYRFVARSSLDQLVPADIVPSEYCLCAEPWNRVFHILFANTD